MSLAGSLGAANRKLPSTSVVVPDCVSPSQYTEAPMSGEKLPASSTCPKRTLSTCEKEGMANSRKAQKTNDLKKDIRDVILEILIPNA